MSLFRTNEMPLPPDKKEAPKIREGKLDWSVLPLKELQEVVKAFEHGVEKYKKPFTYRYGDGIPEKDMLAANMRHLERIQAGELVALDSGCMHWGHIAADALMAIAGILKREETKRMMEDTLFYEADEPDLP